MNTNDLPVTQKLAALMEAGRACNPDMKHARRKWGDGKSEGCAMTYALAGAGVAPQTGEFKVILAQLAYHLGVEPDAIRQIATRIVSMNDYSQASLDEIIEAVREDKLPPAVDFYSIVADKILIANTMLMQNMDAWLLSPHITKTYKAIAVSQAQDASDYSITVSEFPGSAAPQLPKKVRKGQGWSAPVARHAYA